MYYLVFIVGTLFFYNKQFYVLHYQLSYELLMYSDLLSITKGQIR